MTVSFVLPLPAPPSAELGERQFADLHDPATNTAWTTALDAPPPSPTPPGDLPTLAGAAGRAWVLQTSTGGLIQSERVRCAVRRSDAWRHGGSPLVTAGRQRAQTPVSSRVCSTLV